jgi:hypothetical protein
MQIKFSSNVEVLPSCSARIYSSVNQKLSVTGVHLATLLWAIPDGNT